MRFRLVDHGRAFSTRPRGAALLDLLESKARNDEVVVDFTGVTSISYSFADEFIGEMMERVDAGRYGFEPKLDNVAVPLRRVIRRSLENRGVAHRDPFAELELA